MRQLIHVISGSKVYIWRDAYELYPDDALLLEALIADLNSSNCAHEFGLEDTRPFLISEFAVVEMP